MDVLATILKQKGDNVYTVTPHTTVIRAVDEMCRARIGALVVLEERRPVGIFSERDLMTRVVLEQRDPATTLVGEVMSIDVLRVAPSTPPHEAMSMMTEWRVRHLPVLDGDRLVGLVSIGDLVRWSISERDRLIEELERYLAGRYP
jgi:CBS domain-containing protein